MRRLPVVAGHKLGFKGWEIVCACGANFGTAQLEAVRHLRAWKVDAKQRAARTATLARKTALHTARLVLMADWQPTRDLAALWSLSPGHARRWLHREAKAGRVEVARGRGRALRWRWLVH